MVHQRFGIDEIKELSKEQILQAVEYVHELMVKSKGGMNERLSISAQHLAWHTQFIYSWYKAIEEPSVPCRHAYQDKSMTISFMRQ